jgi:glycosyltransferase involved in cell wall biosynthesis
MSQAQRLLYLSAFVPRENAGHAGGRVAHENLCRLQQRGWPVDVVICTTETEAQAPAPAGATVFRQTAKALAAHLALNARGLGVRALLAAPVMHTRLHRGAEEALTRLLRAHDHAEVFIDFTQAILLAQRAVARAARAPRLTACIHDVWVQRLLRSRRRSDALLHGVVAREEQRLLGALAGVLALSAKDRDLLRSLYALDNVAVKPFIAPRWCARVRRTRDGTDPHALLFFANFERHENSSAARWFVERALGSIRETHPSVSLTLVGTGSDALARELARGDVRGTGFIEDPSPYFSRCACAIAPLFEGAGVKFKVLEALACGVPVVGTPVACEGIEPQPALHCVPSERFAAAVVARLSRRVAHE